METEATHVTGVQNRRRMIIMMVGGPHRRGGSRGTQTAAGNNFAKSSSRNNNAGFLEKKKSKLTTKERSYERKCVTHQKEKRGQGNEAASSRSRRTARHIFYEGKHTQNEYFQYI